MPPIICCSVTWLPAGSAACCLMEAKVSMVSSMEKAELSISMGYWLSESRSI